jgi:AcrR family transcriptional regulator
MDYFKELNFRTPEQERAKKTLEDIEDAFKKLAQSGELHEMTSREFSDKAGYAQSTLFHHFKKFDDIFSYMFLVRRRKTILSMVELISKHPADAPLSVLVADIVKIAIEQFNRPPRKALLLVVSKFFKNTKNPQLINIEGDNLIPFWMAVASRDQTNTFVKFTESELLLRFRAFQAVIRSPFFEDKAIAGTSEHSEIAYSLAMNIFSAPVVVD